MSRHDYVIALEITTLAPLTHGAGNDGNIATIRTSEYVVQAKDPETGLESVERIKVPVVTGSSLRSRLRSMAFEDLCDMLGVAEGTVSLDTLRLLLKGGKNGPGGQTSSLDEARRLRDLFPMLSVFGSMDGGLPLRGCIQVSPVVPWCVELHEAGLQSGMVGSVRVDGPDGPSNDGFVSMFTDTRPVPLHMLFTEEQFYRHDLRGTEAARYLAEKDAARVTKRKGKSTGMEGETSNEAMPHATEAIPAGIPMVATLRLHGVTEVEFGCLFRALKRWTDRNPVLGGQSAKGHGLCRVTVAGIIKDRQLLDPNTRAELDVFVGAPLEYHDHVMVRHAACLAAMLEA